MRVYLTSSYFSIICFMIIGVNYSHGGIFSWIFKGYEIDHRLEAGDARPPPTPEIEKLDLTLSDSPTKENFIHTGKPGVTGSSNDEALNAKVPFEIKTADEKFLTEVSKYTSIQISELDTCHHKVILNLRKSCSDLSEEELAKTAVNLLNCQSTIEGRAIYPCTQEMLLHECTGNMDESTWNAYHIVSNRVRAVCYHYRQQQFSAKTEMTVNKLMVSAEEQIGTLKLLEQSHNVLKEATSDTLNSISSGHEMLQKQQDELSVAQHNVRNYVTANMRDLLKEKRLIASGQRELAEITLTIKRKLEDAQAQLADQGSGQRDTHRKILEDLSEIQESASKVWEQIDNSTKKILEKHEQTVTHYARLMDDLQKINGTVHHLMDISTTMKLKVEEKFSWITSIMGDTDATVQKIYSFVLHICYCLLGMVAASFLQVPYATRMALIILVPLNAICEMKNDASLNFSTLSLVLFICMFFNLSTIGGLRIYQWRRRRKSLGFGKSQNAESSFLIRWQGDSSKSERPMRSEPPSRNDSGDEYSSDEDSLKNKSLRGTSLNFTHTSLNSISEDPEKEVQKHKRTSESLSNSFMNQSNGLSLDNVRRRILNSRKSELPSSLTSPISTILRGASTPSSAMSQVNHSTSSQGVLKSPDIGSPFAVPHSPDIRGSFPSSQSVDIKSPSATSRFDSLAKSFSSPRSDASFCAENSFRGNRSRSATPLRDNRASLSQSLSSKKLCIAICKSGLPCKNAVAIGAFCHRHQAGASRESTPVG